MVKNEKRRSYKRQLLAYFAAVFAVFATLLILFQFRSDVPQRNLADSQFLRHFPVVSDFPADAGKAAGPQIFHAVSQTLQQRPGRRIGFRMHASSVQRFLSVPDPQETGALFIGFRPQLGHF